MAKCLFLIPGALRVAEFRFFEIRLNSSSAISSKTEARSCVTYFGTWLSMCVHLTPKAVSWRLVDYVN
jgi:hypothetical protein